MLVYPFMQVFIKGITIKVKDDTLHKTPVQGFIEKLIKGGYKIG